MSDDVNADPEQIDWLSGRVDEAAGALERGQSQMNGDGSMPRSAFGTTPGAEGCGTAWAALNADAGIAAGRLLDVLRSDVDNLEQVAAWYRTTDEEVSGRIAAAGPTTMHVFTTHTTGGEPDQIDGVWDVVGGQEGPTVLTGDFNTRLYQDDDPSQGRTDSAAADELWRFRELGFSDAASEAGGTSLEGNRIDHVFTRDVITGQAERVEGDPSDHDGIVQDVTVNEQNPWW
jgi:endonuclease/exonuclease/phosphatase (EEP) superfamily protein YafD